MGFETSGAARVLWAGILARVWRAIRPDKKHPCWREFRRFAATRAGIALAGRESSLRSIPNAGRGYLRRITNASKSRCKHRRT